MTSPKYVLKKATDGQHMFNLLAANSETILTSERYTSKAGAENGISSVKTNSPRDDRYDRKKSSDNQHYFVLKAANGEPIGRSERYTTAGAMEIGIASVKKNGPIATVDDQT